MTWFLILDSNHEKKKKVMYALYNITAIKRINIEIAFLS